MNKILAKICLTLTTALTTALTKTLTALTTALIIALTVALPAHAQESAKFTIYPSYEHNGNKQWIIAEQPTGSTIKDYITLENLTDSPTTIFLNSVDAEENNGTFIISEETPEKVGAWLVPQESEITLGAKEKRKIAVTISIPIDAESGQYKGSILASHTKSGNESLKITTRIGVRVFLTVTEPQSLYTSIFASQGYVNTMFFLLSLMAVKASILYNLIHYWERKKNAKQSS